MLTINNFTLDRLEREALRGDWIEIHVKAEDNVFMFDHENGRLLFQACVEEEEIPKGEWFRTTTIPMRFIDSSEEFTMMFVQALWRAGVQGHGDLYLYRVEFNSAVVCGGMLVGKDLKCGTT